MKRFSDGEVFGTRLLNAIVFLGAVAILVASLTGPSVKVASNPTHLAGRSIGMAAQG
jgi:hypothetical protein